MALILFKPYALSKVILCAFPSSELNFTHRAFRAAQYKIENSPGVLRHLSYSAVMFSYVFRIYQRRRRFMFRLAL